MNIIIMMILVSNSLPLNFVFEAQSKINNFFGKKVFCADRHLISTILVGTNYGTTGEFAWKIDLRTTILSRQLLIKISTDISKQICNSLIPSNYFFYWCKLSAFAKETYHPILPLVPINWVIF